MTNQEIAKNMESILLRCRVQIVAMCHKAGVHVTEKHYLDRDGSVAAIEIITRGDL